MPGPVTAYQFFWRSVRQITAWGECFKCHQLLKNSLMVMRSITKSKKLINFSPFLGAKRDQRRSANIFLICTKIYKRIELINRLQSFNEVSTFFPSKLKKKNWDLRLGRRLIGRNEFFFRLKANAPTRAVILIFYIINIIKIYLLICTKLILYSRWMGIKLWISPSEFLIYGIYIQFHPMSIVAAKIIPFRR